MTAHNRSTANPIKRLHQEIKAVGIDPKKALATLPEWWEEALAHPSGVIEVKGFLAKHYGLELGPDATLRTRAMPHSCFKTTAGTDFSELTAARAMATAVARVLAVAARKPWSGGLPSAADLRTGILGGDKAPWVDLYGLVAICWEYGIPVAYIPDLPTLGRKMDGMVTFCHGRPVIVITKKPNQPAWILFVLAHEMGHVAQGHLSAQEGESIVDQEIKEGVSGNDGQEAEANSYALELLTGGADRSYRLNYLIPARELAEKAKIYGRRQGVDPGHLLLNMAKTSDGQGRKLYGLANAALKHLEPPGMASALCRAALTDNIDLDELPEDSIQFLESVGLL